MPRGLRIRVVTSPLKCCHVMSEMPDESRTRSFSLVPGEKIAGYFTEIFAHIGMWGIPVLDLKQSAV